MTLVGFPLGVLLLVGSTSVFFAKLFRRELTIESLNIHGPFALMLLTTAVVAGEIFIIVFAYFEGLKLIREVMC